ncbi:EAL domain-containing protein [Atlantibacter hermannii]|uniref:EAL domain-containing protein n=1 Tax=Atlantibacter hermannii TaxID=565 RepID=UPI002541EE14|nr:EAL domain-containing protein [Atlantibacter hermannii]WIF57215.1 EAL domain-containing protein [Atlantibacter hermannii]
MENEINIYVEKLNASINITLPCPLTKNEMFVFIQLLHGKTVNEIAGEYYRSPKTIYSHKKRVYKKLGISNDITFWRDVLFFNSGMLTVGRKHAVPASDARKESPITPEMLSCAIEKNEIKAWFQPVFCSTGGRLSGCEVLARWEHPEKGVIAPELFIPLAESSGLIVPLTSQIMAGTGDLLEPVSCFLPENFHIGINCGVSNFLAPSLEQECESLLARFGQCKVNLVLELTERERFPDKPDVRATFDRLKKQNIYFAMDDFGTGYCGFKYLQYLPLDFIKLDKSIVQQAAKNEISRLIIESITALAEKLSISVIAEGVETPEQAAILAEKGVVYLQGFLYSSPLPGDFFIRKWILPSGTGLHDSDLSNRE